MYKKIRGYIQKWERRCYPKGIPDEVAVRLEQLNKAPSYKQICITIMKNDTLLQTLGFSRTKCKAYNELKKAELIERGVIKPDQQLKLF